MTERFKPIGNKIKRNNQLLNIDFKTENDARLCCKLLNQMDNEHQESIQKLDELFRWYKRHHGCTILEERLGIGYPQRVSNTLQNHKDKLIRYKNTVINPHSGKWFMNEILDSNISTINRIAEELGIELK